MKPTVFEMCLKCSCWITCAHPTCVFEQDLVHIGAGVLEQLVVRVEDDDRDLAVAEHRQLVRLLHQTELSLCEGHLDNG